MGKDKREYGKEDEKEKTTYEYKKEKNGGKKVAGRSGENATGDGGQQ